MTYALYTALAATALIAGFGPAAVVRRVVRGVPVNLRARLGWSRVAAHGTPSGWVHAVSVGEVGVARATAAIGQPPSA